MKTTVITAFFTASFGLAPTLLAGGTIQRLNLPEFKAKCSELQANEQLKPFKAVMSCKQSSTEWRTSKATAPEVRIANFKEIGASFTLKGYEVPFESEAVEVLASFAPCSVMEEVRKTVPAVDIELGCEALSQVESIAELCGAEIDARVEADPDILIEELTGKTFNSCGAN